MTNIQITSYQILSYFLSGIILLLSYFIFSREIVTIVMLKEELNSLQTGSLFFSIIISFILGVAINSFRNAIIEFIFMEWILCKCLGKCGTKINWDFFHLASPEDIAKLEASYYSAYCFSLNFIIVLLISYIFFLKSILTPLNTCILFFVILFLFLYALRLRRQIVKATNKNNSSSTPTHGPLITKLSSAKQLLTDVQGGLDTIEKSI